MKKLIQRLLQTDDLGILQKRANQNWRLLQEFPWLWGTSHYWPLVESNIEVTQDKCELYDFLNETIKSSTSIDRHAHAVTSVWVYCFSSINGRPAYSIKQIWDRVEPERFEPKQTNTTRWFDSIMHQCKIHPENTILNIAVMRHYLGAATIYRARYNDDMGEVIRSACPALEPQPA